MPHKELKLHVLTPENSCQGRRIVADTQTPSVGAPLRLIPFWAVTKCSVCRRVYDHASNVCRFLLGLVSNRGKVPRHDSKLNMLRVKTLKRAAGAGGVCPLVPQPKPNLSLSDPQYLHYRWLVCVPSRETYRSRYLRLRFPRQSRHELATSRCHLMIARGENRLWRRRSRAPANERNRPPNNTKVPVRVCLRRN